MKKTVDITSFLERELECLQKFTETQTQNNRNTNGQNLFLLNRIPEVTKRRENLKNVDVKRFCFSRKSNTYNLIL